MTHNQETGVVSAEIPRERSRKKLVGIPNLQIDHQTQRISLLLPLEDLAQTHTRTLEQLAHQGYSQKSEFHMTAVDIKADSKAAEAFEHLNPTSKAKVLSLLEDADADSWIATTLGEFYLVEKQYPEEDTPRCSIIELVECEELSNLYEQLNLIGAPDGVVFETPPAHVTLATKGSSRGIGISTVEELNTFARGVSITR